jgi:uncharacterized protein YutE (UPF0331/DUF86 family)
MQLSLEIIIEISEMIIAEECFEKPRTHREAIEILGKHGIISMPFARKFSPAIGLRNILVHRYGSIDVKRLYKNLHADIGDFNTFAKYIAKHLKKQRWQFSNLQKNS